MNEQPPSKEIARYSCNYGQLEPNQYGGWVRYTDFAPFENRELVARHLVNQQAEDDGLWFDAKTASEAYLQQELRKLHAAVEGKEIEFKPAAGNDSEKGWLTPAQRVGRIIGDVSFVASSISPQCHEHRTLQGIIADLTVLKESIASSTLEPFPVPFQDRVNDWMLQCFTPTITADKAERNHRFLEESLELVQSLGCTQQEAHMLVDYVFGRPVGEPEQEAGGVMVTLAALGNANSIRINRAADNELARCWTKIDVIRSKQAGKPPSSPLPQSAQPPALEYTLCGWTKVINSAYEQRPREVFEPQSGYPGEGWQPVYRRSALTKEG